MSDIGGLVEMLIAAGTPPGLAARVVAEAFSAGVASAPVRRLSADKMDDTAERRRENDRNRKRIEREQAVRVSADNPQKSADNLRTDEKALTLSSFLTSSLDTEEVKKGKKVRARKAQKSALSADFQPKQSHFDAAEKLGIPRQSVLDKCEDMRIWAASSGEIKADWDATLHGFLRRDKDKLSTNGNGNGPHQPKPGTVPAIANRWAEQFEREARDGIEGHSGTLLRLPQR